MVKCKNCKKEIEKENAISDTPRMYYCSQECLEAYKKKKIKPSADPSRKELLDLIQQYYLDESYNYNEINWNLITAQIKNLIENYGYKYSGIRYTLWYMKEILEKPLIDNSYNGSILNLVPFEYINAQKYYQEQKALKDAFKVFEGNNKKTIIRHNTQRKHRFSIDF